jgi:hypothetical protein
MLLRVAKLEQLLQYYSSETATQQLFAGGAKIQGSRSIAFYQRDCKKTTKLYGNSGVRR